MGVDTPSLFARPVIVRAEGLSKTYIQRRWLSRRVHRISAVEEVELEIAEGSTLALVGESGSGKSTLARCLALLEEPTAGEIWFEGKSVLGLDARERARVRRRVQLLFQDTAAALNPRFSAAEIICEPLAIQGVGTEKDRFERACREMRIVGLSPQWAERRQLELSGGQRQRLAIARALVLEPRLLILDEALTGLDLSIQAQIVNLLLELQAAQGLTYLFISHDLRAAAQIAEEMAVMHEGKIVERGRTADLLAAPRHPRTTSLVKAVPHLEPAMDGNASS